MLGWFTSIYGPQFEGFLRVSERGLKVQHLIVCSLLVYETLKSYSLRIILWKSRVWQRGTTDQQTVEVYLRDHSSRMSAMTLPYVMCESSGTMVWGSLDYGPGAAYVDVFVRVYLCKQKTGKVKLFRWKPTWTRLNTSGREKRIFISLKPGTITSRRQWTISTSNSPFSQINGKFTSAPSPLNQTHQTEQLTSDIFVVKNTRRPYPISIWVTVDQGSGFEKRLRGDGL
jgi:hypothetical protein